MAKRWVYFSRNYYFIATWIRFTWWGNKTLRHDGDKRLWDHSLTAGVNTAMITKMVKSPSTGPVYPPKSPTFVAIVMAASFIFRATSCATGASDILIFLKNAGGYIARIQICELVGFQTCFSLGKLGYLGIGAVHLPCGSRCANSNMFRRDHGTSARGERNTGE